MARLQNAAGAIVSVTDEKAELLGATWTPVDEPKKAPAKKAASSSKTSK